MTADEFREAGIELFGKRGWITDLASCLNVDRSTVHRYLQGPTPIPGPVAAAVACWRQRFRETGQRPLP